MKILHTADWHLGQKFFDYERIEEHNHFFRWLLTIVKEQKPDALLVAGDVFDGAFPSAKSQELFWKFLERLTTENPTLRVIITNGNHDNAENLAAPISIFHKMGIQVKVRMEYDKSGRPEYEDLLIPIADNRNEHLAAVIVALPYLADKNGEQQEEILEEAIKYAHKRFSSLPIILMTHLFAAGSKIVLPDNKTITVEKSGNSVDLSSISRKIAYGALGHLHQWQMLENNNMSYCGCVLPMNFGKNETDLGINMIEITEGNHIEFSRINYTPLKHLISIPSKGYATLSQVLEAIREIPTIEKDNDKSDYAYLQIKVDTEKEGYLKIMEELSKRKVLLCKIEKKNTPFSQTNEISEQENLVYLTPANIIRNEWEKKYGESMTDEYGKMIAEIKREITNSSKE